MMWTTYANISTANLHNEYLQFSHRDVTFALLPITSSVTLTDSDCPSIKAPSWQLMDGLGKIVCQLRYEQGPNICQTCYHLSRRDMMISRLVE